MPFRIRDVQVSEEIAAQAGSDGTPPFELSPFITPVIFGPQRPPLASSGYFPGCMGLALGGIALNTSHIGIFVSGTNTDTIVRVNSITIMNSEAAEQDFTIRRLDDASGFTLAALIPGYISAGNPVAGGVFAATRNNIVAPQGIRMATVMVEAARKETFFGPWIVNNGVILVAPSDVDTVVRAYFNYEAWPSIRQQPIPG